MNENTKKYIILGVLIIIMSSLVWYIFFRMDDRIELNIGDKVTFNNVLDNKKSISISVDREINNMINTVLEDVKLEKVNDPYKLALNETINIINKKNSYMIGQLESESEMHAIIIFMNPEKSSEEQYVSKSKEDVYSKLKNIIINITVASIIAKANAYMWVGNNKYGSTSNITVIKYATPV